MIIRVLLGLLGCSAPVLAQSSPPATNLTLTPAAEPRPALRYALLPPTHDQIPGNAAVHYFRAMLLRPSYNPEKEPWLSRERQATEWELPSTRYEQLPVAEVRAYLENYRRMLREAETGSRCERCDWQSDAGNILDRASVELPSLQGQRRLGLLLSLRAKLELAEGRTEAALHSIQTGLQLGRRVGESSSLIQLLMGQAIVEVQLDRVQDLITHPDAPNLYWALSRLPHPLIDPRTALDGEAQFLDRLLPGVKELRAGPVSPERARELAMQFVKALTAGGGVVPPELAPQSLEIILTPVGFAAYSAVRFQSAKKDLLARGWADMLVETMPAGQIVLLSLLERVSELTHDQAKWFFAPPLQGLAGQKRVAERMKSAFKPESFDPLHALMVFWAVPTTEKVYAAHVRCERRIAALRVLEAIRLHVALSLQVPAKLEEIASVPMPSDPVTGKPFVYQRTDSGFILGAPPPTGEIATPANTLRFEVTLRDES